jgi:hypothetical protein
MEQTLLILLTSTLKMEAAHTTETLETLPTAMQCKGSQRIESTSTMNHYGSLNSINTLSKYNVFVKFTTYLINLAWK